MEEKRIGVLSYNKHSSRWCLNFYVHIEELHCGDCFQIEWKNNKWEEVRIEYSNNEWYLVTSIGDVRVPNYQCRVKEV